MTTIAVVLLVVAGLAIGAVRLWISLSALPSVREPLADAWLGRRQWKQFQRLQRRDPAAARAYAEHLEAELDTEYEALRERAARDPAAAATFAQRASEELLGLRALATDAAAASTVAELQLRIARVERDLAWAQQFAAPNR